MPANPCRIGRTRRLRLLRRCPATRRVTPVARRLAERHGVDADRLEGTGPGGRVTKDDVKRAIDAGTAPMLKESALEEKASAKPASESAARGESIPDSKPSGEPPHDVIPLTGIRRVTAERLSAHWTAAPQVTEGVDIDMTEVRTFRTAHRDEWRAKFGVMPSLNDIVLKAVAVALESHPALNSALIDGEIHRYREINLGVAVDIEDGLVVPVLRNAGGLDLGGIASAVADLTSRAKAGKLTLENLEGATFTVSNLSALGVDWFTPGAEPPAVRTAGGGQDATNPDRGGTGGRDQGHGHLHAHLRPPGAGRCSGGSVSGEVEAVAGVAGCGVVFGSG